MSFEYNLQSSAHGGVTGTPNLVLRGEGFLVSAVATYAYYQTTNGWLMFAILFLTPDIFMLGYLRNNKTGSLIYNIGHTYILPGSILLAAHLFAQPMLVAVSLIWIAHIGFDRVLGYGLKYVSGFKHTHLSSRI